MSNKDQTSGAFLANISHEIRTPLNAIIGMTELLMETNFSAPQCDYLKVVHQSSEELLDLVNDILTLSKLETETLKLEAMPFNLLELVDSVIDRFVKQADQKQIQLFCDVEPCNLPQLIGDPTCLRKVLAKLIDNALKFTESTGEVILKVEAIPFENSEFISHSTRLRLQVCDTGIGISQEYLATIFDNFTQAEDFLTRRSGGTGIGLSITKRLVELLGGTLKVDSQLGKGSRLYFDLDFPLDVVCCTEINNLQPHLNGIKTLLIEENKTGRGILSKLLRGWGAEVTVAEDCSAADAILARPVCEFSLAFMTWRDSSRNGADVARGWIDHVTQRGGQVVLIASRESMNSKLVDDTNNLHYLTQPVRPNRLINLLVNELGYPHLKQNSKNTLQ